MVSQLTVRNGGDGGAMCPLLDKPEQGIELVSEALTQLEFKERFGVVVNCAAHEIFDNVSHALRLMCPFRTLPVPVFRTLLVLVSSHAKRCERISA